MNKLKRYELITLILIFIFTIFYFYNESIAILNVENIRNFINYFGIFSFLIFIFLFIFLALIGFPVSLLYFFSGMIFGFKNGYFISILGAFLSAFLAFSISRYLLKNFIHKPNKINNKKRFADKLVDKIKDSAATHGFRNILMLRLYFMPYIELSYASGLVKELKIKDFLIATLLVNFIESFIFIFLGASIVENIFILFLSISLVLLFISIPRFYKKHQLNIHFKKH